MSLAVTSLAPAFAQDAGAGEAAVSATRTAIGDLDGVAYRIDVPADWNRNLLVYFHGWEPESVRYAAGPPAPELQPLLARGYAVAQSAYTGTGWAVEQAGSDSERLRRHFVAKYGRPRQTFAMGHSMGGLLTVQALELRPQVYAGGLALCGVIGAGDRAVQRLFALRAAFDHYFPDVFGPLVPVPADYRLSKAQHERVLAALRAAPDRAARMRALAGAASDEGMAMDLLYFTAIVRELQQRTGANPFGNADLVYTGSADDGALNDGVRRYRADPAAAGYLARHYTPSGRLERPLLALHTTGDAAALPAAAFEYALLAQRAQRGERFVQQYVKADGHCEITPEQTAQAFDELVAWVAGGERPQSGPLR